MKSIEIKIKERKVNVNSIIRAKKRKQILAGISVLTAKRHKALNIIK